MTVQGEGRGFVQARDRAAASRRSAGVKACSERVIHPRAVEGARKAQLDAGELAGMAEFFKVLGDPTRLGILHALLQGELCVCDLSVVLGMSVSAVSHQLSVLRQARLLSSRRDGKVVFYSLADHHVKDVITTIRAHSGERSEILVGNLQA